MDDLFPVKYSDDQVKSQVDLVLSFGKRTVEESIKLGEMLVLKKEEKGHGNWVSFLDEVGLARNVAWRLMKAYQEQDNYVEGMTFSELVKDTKCSESEHLQEEKDPYEGWSDEEKGLRQKWDDGETVVINMDTHKNLVRYASDLQVYARIDRGTAWGNPFLMPQDGTRDEVCDWYASYYMPYKKSLLDKITTLKGKMLGCHCYPQRCHGDHLIELLNGTD